MNLFLGNLPEFSLVDGFTHKNRKKNTQTNKNKIYSLLNNQRVAKQFISTSLTHHKVPATKITNSSSANTKEPFNTLDRRVI